MGYRWWALAVVSLGTLTVHLDTTVNVALPAITNALDAPLPSIQWIIIGYVLTTAATLVGVGRLTDLVGRRAIWCWGLVALAAALLLDSLAPTIQVLVACRILQAVGATMVYAAGPAIVTEAFPSGERGRAIGIMTMGGQIGMAVGPLLGGWLVATFGWPAIFWARVPVAALVGLVSFRVIRDLSRPAGGARFDVWGSATLGLAMVTLLFGIDRLGALGWASWLASGLLALSALLFGLFVWIERRVAAPVLDPTLFRDRVFVAANAINLLGNLSMFGLWLLVPYYLAQAQRLEPLMAGLLLSVVPISSSLLSPLAGWLSDRIGAGRLTLVGLVLQAIALLSMARLDAASPIVEVVAVLVLLGIAIGVYLAPNISVVMGAVPHDRLGVASGMVATMRSLGVVTSVALLTSVYAARAALVASASSDQLDPSAFVVSAFQAAFLVSAVICAVAVVLALERPKPPP